MYTVLVVDDEKVIRDGCCRILSAKGHRVLSATSGRTALDLLASEPVNAILCGLKMPGMDALEVLEEVRGSHPEIPMIIITGEGTVANAIKCMKKGAYDFVTKPFRADDLVAVVTRALEKRPPLLRSQSMQMEE
jgi:two-component system, OmpR family, phosphate regulon sensor histidine kinase PhoR